MHVKGRYDPDEARQAMAWIAAVTGEDVSLGSDMYQTQEDLKDGIILCKLINCLQPGSVKKINDNKWLFKLVGDFFKAPIRE